MFMMVLLGCSTREPQIFWRKHYHRGHLNHTICRCYAPLLPTSACCAVTHGSSAFGQAWPTGAAVFTFDALMILGIP